MIAISEEEYEAAIEESAGWCLACNERTCGIEPDAERYQCPACGSMQLYGAEQLLLMGEIDPT